MIYSVRVCIDSDVVRLQTAKNHFSKQTLNSNLVDRTSAFDYFFFCVLKILDYVWMKIKLFT